MENGIVVETIGGTPPGDLQHLITGFYSFDQALACGMPRTPGGPTNVLWEIFGYQGVGKSTLVEMLAAKAAGNKTICYAAIEPCDPSMVVKILSSSGFTGKLIFIQHENHEDTLEEVLLREKDENTGVVILDSLGALQAAVNVDNDLEDANMGKNAFLINKFARTSLLHLRNRKSPILILATNHIHQIMGGRGTTTSGGVVMGYATRIRLFLSSGERFDDGTYVLTGRVDKNSYGLENGHFRLVFLADYGFHEGLTAWQDCEQYGLAKRDRVIKMGDTSFGFASKLIQQAKDGNVGIFQPFKDALLELGK